MVSLVFWSVSNLVALYSTLGVNYLTSDCEPNSRVSKFEDYYLKELSFSAPR